MSLIQIKNATGPKYWRSLDELAQTPEFNEWISKEFPGGTETLDGPSRRNVLKVMAASFGLAGFAACRRPVERILPYSHGVEDMIPGRAYYYATVMPFAGQASGLIVETHDGRPTKIEGNPDHPMSLGAATAMQQAAILSLYDPDRSARFLENGKPTEKSWKEFDAYLKSISLGDGSGVRFLSQAVNSPSLEAVRADALKKLPKAKWVEYEPTARENGTMLAFGQSLAVHRNFEKAKVVFALDADFLGLDSITPLPTKQFSKRRRFTDENSENLNRLYVVESQYSITGMNADHRLRMKPSEVKEFAKLVAMETGALSGFTTSAGDKQSKFAAAVAKDLKSAGAEALVVAGPRQPAIVHAIAHAINQSLGSQAVSYTKSDASAGVDGLKTLATEMNNGQVSALFILGGNPVYSAPADLQFAAALSKVANSVHLGEEEDETAASAKWHVPQANFLESWGDARSSDGTVSIQQPMIDTMYGGKTPAEMVALITDAKDKSGHDIVKNYWLAQFPAKDAEKTWRKALHDGVVASVKPAEAAKASIDLKKLSVTVGADQKASSNGLEIAFVPSASTFDGRFANNGWMQEAPDPMSKLVWGNAALMSPATAKAQNLEDSSIVTISHGNYKLDAAIMLQPGLADDVIVIPIGYGRTKCGRVGTDVGFNANLIRTSDGFWSANGVSLAPTGRSFTLVTTAERGLAEHQNDGLNLRPIIREASIEEYKKNPKVIEEKNELPELQSVYPELAYNTGYQWGMSIDLTSCTGCNACVVACQAENNSPVVGKDQVRRGREMHWIRMDRYYTGTQDDPKAVSQPVPCMQCQNAPCENVCPVAATSHSPEGLNDMAYNRCVGTRYCSNNCPFKVRHFNFLNFHKHEPEILGMMYNPDVTVRMRGVMEKCTYCVQRIQEMKIKAQGEGRRQIKDGEILTACQQTCPAEAIVFGNINDPESRVSKLKKQERDYAMLAEFDIRPRTTYLAKVHNPNPELEA
jgi:MoCo/4Fe-4S cofactor protein with predicted Tat translocation signal